jgi:hypothetical protein
MTYTSTVSFDAMKTKLMTLDEARTMFQKTEPLAEATFDTGTSGIRVRYGSDDWHHGEATDPVPVWLDVPDGERYQLTRQGAMELGSTCRINQGVQEFWPADVMERAVNWALRSGLGERELKLLTAGTGEFDGDTVPLAVAQCRATISPFSNLRLLDIVLERARKLFGSDTDSALVDYKWQHDLEQSICRVIFPGQQVIMDRTGVDDDAWCIGVELRNSLIGLKQTALNGYLFRFTCTNGAVDVAHSAGGFKRLGSTPEDAYLWAQETVDSVLGGLEETLDGVQALVDQKVEGFVVADLREMFKQYGVPKSQRVRVIEAMADTGGVLTAYDLVAAVTRAANMDGMKWRDVDHLLNMGGGIVHAESGRCSKDQPCMRRLPSDWEPPQVPELEPAE